MATVRPLHEVLDDLATGSYPGPAADALRAGGHELPADLVAEAVVSFADTAPVEVAEHLAPYVIAHTTGGDADPALGLDLLASAPVPAAAGDLWPDHDPTTPAGIPEAADLADSGTPAANWHSGIPEAADLADAVIPAGTGLDVDFGRGYGDASVATAPDAEPVHSGPATVELPTGDPSMMDGLDASIVESWGTDPGISVDHQPEAVEAGEAAGAADPD